MNEQTLYTLKPKKIEFSIDFLSEVEFILIY